MMKKWEDRKELFFLIFIWIGVKKWRDGKN